MKALVIQRPGIYAIENVQNTKLYVGSTVNLRSRTREHVKALQKGIHCNKKLQAAFDLDGEENFKITILEFCSRDRLFEREQYWMDKFDVTFHGYNICEVANAPSWRGRKREAFSAEWCKKLSEVAKRPRPSQSVAIKKYWDTVGRTRVTLTCVDCSDSVEVVPSAAEKYADPYRCRSCYLKAYKEKKLTNRSTMPVVCPDCGVIRYRKPSHFLRKQNGFVCCLSCVRKGDRNSGSKRRLANLATNLSFITGCP